MQKKYIERFGAAILYLAIILSLCLPLKLLSPPHILGINQVDLTCLCWDQWFHLKSITELDFSSIWHTNFIAYPNGINIFLEHGPPFWELTSIIFQILFPFPSSHTFIVIFIILLNAYCFFLLGKYLYKNSLLAFFIGILGSINPYVIYHANCGRLQQIAIFWLPLYLISLFKIKLHLQTKHFFIAAILLILTAFSYWYYAVFLIFTTLIFFCCYILAQKEKLRFTKYLFSIILLFTLIMLMLFGYPVIIKGLCPQEYGVIKSFPSFQAIISQQTSGYFIHIINSTSLRIFPVSLLLIIIVNILSILNRKLFKKNLFWVITADFFYILSLGPYLKIFDKYTPSLLFMLTHQLPTLSRLWWPVNYLALSMTCSIIVIVYYIYHLSWNNRSKSILVLSLLSIYLLLFYSNQYSEKTPFLKHSKFYFSQITPHQEVYFDLKQIDTKAIIELPFNETDESFLYNQRIHQKNIFNCPGYEDENFIWPKEQLNLLQSNLFLQYIDMVCKHYTYLEKDIIIPQKFNKYKINKALKELLELGIEFVVINPQYAIRYREKDKLIRDLSIFFPTAFKTYSDGVKIYCISELIKTN